MLPLYHQLKFGSALNYKVLGYKKLKDILDNVQSLWKLAQLGQEAHDFKLSTKHRMINDVKLFSRRSLPRGVIEYPAKDASLLANAREKIVAVLPLMVIFGS